MVKKSLVPAALLRSSKNQMNLKNNTKQNSSFKKNTEILHQIRCFVSFKKLQDLVDLI